MSILQLFPADEFYDKKSLRPFEVGQFCWIPVPHLDPIPRILAVERNTATEHETVKCHIRDANQSTDFQSSERVLPLKYLKLRSNEEMLVQRAKKRPGIILSTGMDIFPDIARLLRQSGKKHLQEDSHFVVPCYGIQEGAYGSGFPPAMLPRIQCLLYKQFFYLPSGSGLKEGIARFDRIQVVIGDHPAAITPMEFGLSPKVYSLFLAMFLYCISGAEDEELTALRAILREAYPSED